MMVMFSKIPVVALVAMLSATGAAYTAQTDFSGKPTKNVTTLANAARQRTRNVSLAEKLYPKVTKLNKLGDAFRVILIIDTVFLILNRGRLDDSNLKWAWFWGLPFFGSGLVVGKNIGMDKIYRQLTRKFGTDWLSWGLKKSKPAVAVPAKVEAGA